jgi:pimeloyl-ACP methyl ester carboxylesterase
VLAHGFSDDGLCWTPIAEALASDYDVIMVDARGHGRSAGPEQGYGLTDMAEDLASVISGLGLHKPAVLGHSMGGATTMTLAGLYPELPGAILIEDAGMFGMARAQTPEAQERQKRMFGWIIELKRKTREEMIAECRTNSPTWPEAELGPWADSKLRFSFHAINRLGTAPVEWTTLLPRVACPALLLTADTDRGAIVSSDDAAAMQGLIPQLQVVHIAGAGHNIRREQFSAFMSAVRAFLTTANSG